MMIHLTPNQKRIIDLRVEGYIRKDIAQICKVSERSVKDTLEKIYKIIHVPLDSSEGRLVREEKIKKAYNEYLYKLAHERLTQADRSWNKG